jgi:hypothetical protein
MKFKVALELEGIPPHAWAVDTATKILAPSYWLHAVAFKADLSAYKLSAWTCDPRAIPKVVWLHIAENEVVHVRHADAPIFGNLPPYLWRKDVLGYRVLVHLRHVTDFDPANPSPPPSPPKSDDGDSGHDGNPDRHHFSRGTGPCIQGFRCARGIVDGEPAANGNLGSRVVWGANISRYDLVLQQQKVGKQDASGDLLDLVSQSCRLRCGCRGSTSLRPKHKDPACSQNWLRGTLPIRILPVLQS